MKHLVIVLRLFFFISFVGNADEIIKEQTPKKTPIQCGQTQDTKQGENLKDCQTLIEKIVVHGNYVGIEIPEVVGRFVLNKKFIDSVAKTNGDINDIIALLPGIQTSESALDVSNLTEISAQEISISGAKPWQTGFFLDGMNYNNRIDPGAGTRIQSTQNEVSGGVQSMNVNSQIVSSIEVYDNNIPAEYGEFSGGVVKANTANPLEEPTKFILGYRGSHSNWGKYHHVTPNFEQRDSLDDVQVDTSLIEPIFEKNSFDFIAQTKFNKHHGLLVNMNYLESNISDISLGASKSQQRKNANILVKYQYRDGWIDDLSAKFVYAPYKSHTYLKDVLNSEHTINGGNQGLSLSLSEGFDLADWHSELNISQSDNSRQSPDHHYIWLKVQGKEWGNYGNSFSLEGGFGDLDNTQVNTTWKNTLQLNEFNWADSSHSLRVGAEIQHQQIERYRPKDHYNYESPVIHAVGLSSNQLNCSGYRLDCVERELQIPLEQLEELLGESYDPSNPEHIIAYSDNVIVTPQYFKTRTVYLSEKVAVDLTKSALFITDNIDYNQWNINLGLRYSYDDFFQNHDLAPRLSLGYDVFEDNTTLIVSGLNRYYDAGLLTYKIDEQQASPVLQYRPIQDGYLQGWLKSSSTDDFKYKYTDVDTPYNDEFVLGLKQATQDWGNFSLKVIKRWQKAQLAKDSTSDVQDDGYRYITMGNDGSGNNTRYTFSWDVQIKSHSLWLNASHTKSYQSNSSYNSTIDNTPTNEVISLNNELINYSELEIIQTNFARPFTLNAGWNASWLDNFSTTLTASYSEAYNTVLQDGYISTTELTNRCDNCEIVQDTIPNYYTSTIRARTLISLSSQWTIPLSQTNKLEFRFDINNLLNARTYTVPEDSYGIETGTQFWLGVSYKFQ